MHGNIRLDRFTLLAMLCARCLWAQAPDIMDIAPPVDVPRPVPWGYILAATVVITAAAAWYFLRHANSALEPVTFIGAHELALQRIEALAAVTDVPALFGELEQILRGYLERRFDVEAAHATLKELGEQMSQRGAMARDRVEALQALLDTCEMVRFGGYRPAEAIVRETLDAARAWIEQTQLRLAEPSKGSLLFGGALPGSASDAAH